MKPTGALLLLLTIVIVDAQFQPFEIPGLRSLSALRTEIRDVWKHDADRACGVLQIAIRQYERAIYWRLSGRELAEGRKTLAALKKMLLVNFITCGK